jgi:vacuolar protein sorting-associated protein 13A/C
VAKVLLGTDLKTCMDTLAAKADDSAVHLLRRVNMTWRAERCILPQVPNLTAFKVAGHLPELAMDFSDAKYRNLMKVIDQAVPHFDGYEEPATTSQEKSNAKASSAANDRKKSFSQAPLYNDDDDDLHLTDDEAVEEPRPVDGSKDDDKDQFFEAPDLPDTVR